MPSINEMLFYDSLTTISMGVNLIQSDIASFLHTNITKVIDYS
jgi:hypothetical protein